MVLRASQEVMHSIRHCVLASTITLGTGCFSPGTPPPFEPEDASTTSSGTDPMGSEGTHASTSLDGSSSGLVGPGDTTPPEVVDFLPADGTSHVWDETLTISFSEPMDQASVAAAFPEASGFTWDEAGMQVEIANTFPFQSVPVLHYLVVPTSVTDLAGNGLAEPVVVTIELAALQTVDLLHEPALTGYSLGGFTGAWFVCGDAHDGSLAYGGISFSLDGLDSALAIRRATFRSQVLQIDGDIDDPGLGGVVMDHVVFDGISDLEDSAALEKAFAPVFVSRDVAVGEVVDVDVTDQLEWSWSAGIAYFQLRIHSVTSNDDMSQDLLWLRRGADEDDSLVSDGFTEPDPDNQSRIEIVYFQ
jgi:hypothetical protein